MIAVIDERWRGQGDARPILTVRPGNLGEVLVTTPLERALSLAGGISEASNAVVEVAP